MKKKKPAKRSLNPGTLCRIGSILVAAIGVFWLPWHVSPTAPVVGESYVLGFNNHVGIMALGAAIFLGIAACYFGVPRPASYKWIHASPDLLPTWKEARAEYWILICICVVMAAANLIWSSYLVDPAWCDARGFIYGIDLLAVGQVPYRDFMYNYGPATIYLPLWLSKISAGSLSFEQSYTIVLVILSTGGFAALFIFLRSLEIPKTYRPVILGIALLGWTCISLAMQYTPIRYLIVPVALLFLNAVVCKQIKAGIVPLIWICGAAAIGTVACLGISPEMGIAGTVGVAAYGFVLILRRSISGAAACWLGACLAFGATMLAFPGYLDSVFAFGSGGSNFPIFPNLHNLCLVTISLIVFPSLIASTLANPGEERSPLALALAVGGGMLLPGAFGRCDPGHVVSYGLIPALVMFAAAAGAGKIALRIWIFVYAIFFVILTQVSYWNTYVNNFAFGIQMHQYYEAHPDLVASWRTKWDALRLSTPHGKDLHWSKVLPFPDSLGQLTSKGRVLLTDGNEGNLWLARFLLLQTQPPQEYFDAYSQGAGTPAQIDRKVREDEAYRFLIVPESVVGSAAGSVNLVAYQHWITTFLSKLLLFPVDGDIKNAPYLPDVEYARRILRDYKPIGRYQSYIVLDKQAAAATP